MRPATGPRDGAAEWLAAVVGQSPDMMIYADLEGRVRLWNQAAERFFGHTAAEMLGNTLDEIIPQRFQAAHWAGFHHAVGTGQTKYEGRVMTTRSVHKDGRALYVDLCFGLVRNRDGVVMGVLATGRAAQGHR